MFWTQRPIEYELEWALVGIHATEFQVRTKVRYREFIRSSLLGRLPLSASSTAGVSILASRLFLALSFKFQVSLQRQLSLFPYRHHLLEQVLGLDLLPLGKGLLREPVWYHLVCGQVLLILG